MIRIRLCCEDCAHWQLTEPQKDHYHRRIEDYYRQRAARGQHKAETLSRIALALLIASLLLLPLAALT